MGFEDPKFISEFVVLNPEDTDQRAQGAITMRSIKNAIVGTGTVDAGSFTPNATGQYTGTMDEIQFATDNAIPTDDTTTPPEISDLLQFDGNNWVPVSPSVSAGISDALYADYLGEVNGDEVYFALTVYDNVPGSLATIKNDGADGRGWLLTAAADIAVNINFSVQVGGNSTTINTGVCTIEKNIADTSVRLDVGRQSYSGAAQSFNFTANLGAAVVLTAGNTLSLVSVGHNTINEMSCSLTVQAIA
jgi:hypothetical protein